MGVEIRWEKGEGGGRGEKKTGRGVVESRSQLDGCVSTKPATTRYGRVLRTIAEARSRGGRELEAAKRSGAGGGAVRAELSAYNIR